MATLRLEARGPVQWPPPRGRLVQSVKTMGNRTADRVQEFGRKRVGNGMEWNNTSSGSEWNGLDLVIEWNILEWSGNGFERNGMEYTGMESNGYVWCDFLDQH